MHFLSLIKVIDKLLNYLLQYVRQRSEERTAPIMTMPYTAVRVANTILFEAGLSTISPMKLQKLLYFAHGWHLAIQGRPLINETVQAWKYGPVVPSVYQVFKTYGAQEIEHFYQHLKIESGDFRLIKPFIPSDDETTCQFISRFMEVYNRYTAIQLSTLSHLPNSPWSKIREEYGDCFSVPIPDDLIRDYFIKVGRKQTEHSESP